MPRFRCLIDDPADKEHKLLLLDAAIQPGTLTGLEEEVQSKVKDACFEVTSYDLKLTYQNFSADEILKRILADGIDVPCSFETIGHIAHYNLREEHLPYRYIIGQVCIDKNPSIRTVVTKVGEIENEFRVFSMVVVAGEPNFVTEVSQHGYRFRLDYSRVFWNSRLEHEHMRLVAHYFKPGCVVADIMAGIGPFVIPAAKKGCTVYSNDLNPDSTRWLRVNAKLNKVERRVHSFCMDGRAFVRLLCATPGGPADNFTELAAQLGSEVQPGPVPRGWQPPAGGVLWEHGIMNLPRTAVNFCDAFRGAFDPSTWRGRLPMIHCYTFQKKETRQDVLLRVEAALGGPFEEAPAVHEVRNVAPDKFHVCVSFRVPESVAFAGRTAEPDCKRAKTGTQD